MAENNCKNCYMEILEKNGKFVNFYLYLYLFNFYLYL